LDSRAPVVLREQVEADPAQRDVARPEPDDACCGIPSRKSAKSRPLARDTTPPPAL
jgi:hypothetical protein